jgi:hypothetical protein
MLGRIEINCQTTTAFPLFFENGNAGRGALPGRVRSLPVYQLDVRGSRQRFIALPFFLQQRRPNA